MTFVYDLQFSLCYWYKNKNNCFHHFGLVYAKFMVYNSYKILDSFHVCSKTILVFRIGRLIHCTISLFICQLWANYFYTARAGPLVMVFLTNRILSASAGNKWKLHGESRKKVVAWMGYCNSFWLIWKEEEIELGSELHKRNHAVEKCWESFAASDYISE